MKKIILLSIILLLIIFLSLNTFADGVLNWTQINTSKMNWAGNFSIANTTNITKYTPLVGIPLNDSVSGFIGDNKLKANISLSGYAWNDSLPLLSNDTYIQVKLVIGTITDSSHNNFFISTDARTFSFTYEYSTNHKSDLVPFSLSSPRINTSNSYKDGKIYYFKYLFNSSNNNLYLSIYNETGTLKEKIDTSSSGGSYAFNHSQPLGINYWFTSETNQYISEILVWNSSFGDQPILTGQAPNIAPTLITNIPNQTWSHNTNLTLNLTSYFSDPDNSLFNYSGNSTNIATVFNQSTGIVTLIPNINFTGTDTIVFFINDSINVVASNNITLTLNNTKPNVTITITPKPQIELSNITLIINYSDIENDTWIYNETKWYINNIYNSTFDNMTFIYSGNFSMGQLWTVSVRVFDFYNWSDWYNDSVQINISIKPNIFSFNVSSRNIYTTDSLNFSIISNTTQGTMVSTSCIIGLYKSDLTITDFNISTNIKTNDIFSRLISVSSFGTGNLEWTNIWCADISGNINSTTPNINISISTLPTPAPTGGGGGGGTVSECGTDDDCNKFGLSYYCISSKCVKLTRDDIANTNLLKRNLPQTIINQLIQYGQGICNWDGVCESIDQGENGNNCGSQRFTDRDGQTYIIEGDCTGLEFNLPTSFLQWSALVAVIIVIVLSVRRKK